MQKIAQPFYRFIYLCFETFLIEVYVVFNCQSCVCTLWALSPSPIYSTPPAYIYILYTYTHTTTTVHLTRECVQTPAPFAITHTIESDCQPCSARKPAPRRTRGNSTAKTTDNHAATLARASQAPPRVPGNSCQTHQPRTRLAKKHL